MTARAGMARRRSGWRVPWVPVALVLAGTLAALAGCSGGGGHHPAGSPASGPATFSGPGTGAGSIQWPTGANGNSPAEVDQWGTYIGHSINVAVTFTVRDSWGQIVGSNWPITAFPRAGFPGTLSVAQPLFPQSGNVTACASGAYDGYWAQFGRTMTANNRADSYVRLGWEFNGDWFWWAAYNPPAWKTCFQRSAAAIKSTDPAARIEWNISAHRDKLPGGQDLWSVYPGDQYVDVISVDDYDSYPASTTDTIWKRQCEAPSGLCTAVEFARAHHKKFAVPEWGLVRSTGGGGDNPFYIRKMHEFFTGNRDILAYEAYFNTAEANNVRSSLRSPVLNPRAASEYLNLFGNG
jgi:hypothetical protein